jgi:hypothetical protein
VSLLYNWPRTKPFIQSLSAQSVWNTWVLGTAHYTHLLCIELYCDVLCCAAMFCTVLYWSCAALCCIILDGTLLHCIILFDTILCSTADLTVRLLPPLFSYNSFHISPLTPHFPYFSPCRPLGNFRRRVPYAHTLPLHQRMGDIEGVFKEGIIFR